jgi:alpha-amylase
MRGPRRATALVVVVLAAVIAAPAVGQGEGAAGHSVRAPVTDESFYFVMTDRFENGSSANDRGGLKPGPLISGYDPRARGFYHGGDLKGLLQRLDYIKGLGTTALWLTPTFKNKPVQLEDGPSAGYHGYWITDFTQVDPHLGTNQELRTLVEAAHARGMKVFFDIITNHTADVIDHREATRPGYVSKDESPYRTAFGNPFDDRDFASGGFFPPLDAETSFPYTPFNPPGSETLKVPAWLNEVELYHNRGNTTFVGEDSYYGDFFGLDDLFTEHPRVVNGLIDVYKTWIADFGIDGFRIDTMRHVNDEFWQRFAPEVLGFARDAGKREFFMFGEVFDRSRPFTSHFTTHDRVQAVLDFPFLAAAEAFAARSGPTDDLRDLFLADDWYTDADSNVYQLPTFLGNHDVGRIGLFIREANAGASDAEALARDRLAHELMYLSRGNPVVYYGDEQGFVGDGGDQLARQDMFGSRVAEYNDDDLIGTDATTKQSNFVTTHPLYRAIAALAELRRGHSALRDGAHQHRYSTNGPGIYAFSRLDRGEQREYVVALNNSESAQTAAIPTYAARADFGRIYGDGAGGLQTDAQRRLTVSVPPLSAVVYRAIEPLPGSPSAPPTSLTLSAGPHRDRVEVGAHVDGDSFYEVTFVARTRQDAGWQAIGTDDTAPYRVFHDVADLNPDTRIEYRATALDNRGHTRTSAAHSLVIAPPSIEIQTPAEGAKVRGRAEIGADVVPEHSDDVVSFQRRLAAGAWTPFAADSSSPSPYKAFDDIAALGLTEGTPIQYRAVLTYDAQRTVTSAVRTVEVAPPSLTVATVHYGRPAADWDSWGLHLWGDAIADGVATDWLSPRQPTSFDAFGAAFEIPLKDDTKPVNFIVHTPGGDSVPTTREPGGDRSFVPLDHPQIWLLQGDPTVYFTPPG